MSNMLKAIRFLATKMIIKIMGDEEMMIILLAARVVLGKTDFKDLPEVLKPAVYQELKDNGVEFLAGDYEPPVTE